MDYDEDGLPVSWTHSGGYVVEFDRVGEGIAGRVAAMRVRRGSEASVVVRRYGYDSAGNLAQEFIGDGSQAFLFGYDRDGRMTWWQDRNEERYDYTYDADGRCVAGTSVSGTLSGRLTYDLVAQTTTVWDANRAVFRYEWDEAGRVTLAVDPNGLATRTQWDQVGRKIAVCDPSGVSTRWGYDSHGGPVRVTDPSGVTTSVVCDQAGLPVRVTDGAGRVVNLGRDVLGRVVTVRDAAGESVAAYDVDGNVVWARDGDGVEIRYSYDGEGNLVTARDGAGRETCYEYGRFDLCTAMVDATGARTEFEYDPTRQLTTLTDPLGRTWRWERDAAGQVLAQIDVNGARTADERDVTGRVTSRTNAVGQHVRYGYDPSGLLTWSEDQDATGTAGVRREFTYDPTGRLLNATIGDHAPGSLTITRDVLGQVTHESWITPGAPTPTPGRPDTTAAVINVSSSYDRAGRLVRQVTPTVRVTTWGYDDSGVMTRVVAGRYAITIDIDTAGQEISRHVVAAPEPPPTPSAQQAEPTPTTPYPTPPPGPTPGDSPPKNTKNQ
ncbi:hypothetical protein, partial [Austwickia sp. TVS 96-490-7B]|uniref:hypothetical protein n=1 Tax=Austwickia sp. TVS 96-490-7B TaxID=2830843 RepID=UPI001C59DD23